MKPDIYCYPETDSFCGPVERIWVAKSRPPWWEGVARRLLRPIAAEWQQQKVQGSVASQDDEWQVTAAAVVGLRNLTGSNQPKAGAHQRQVSLQRLLPLVSAGRNPQLEVSSLSYLAP